MFLADKQIKEIGPKVITPFDESKVGAISYDLTAKSFYSDVDRGENEYTLEPFCSVFVESEEEITLPNNMLGMINLRNSRLRQGLSLESPVYQPGHKTPVFFRVTNTTASRITLKKGDGLASIMISVLSSDVEIPYSGTFQNESQYKGMGDYHDVYSKSIKNFDKKFEDVKNVEKSIYSNVLAIMAIFVAAFSILNVNVTLCQSAIPIENLVIFNLCTIGAIAFLVAMIHKVSDKGVNVPLVVISVICFVTAIVTCLGII